jgi:hypothetical protein
MSVNRETDVGLCTPKSVPHTAISASLRSDRVGSLVGQRCCSVTMTPAGPPSCV